MTCKNICILIILIVGVRGKTDYYDYGIQGVPGDDEWDEWEIANEQVESKEAVNTIKPVTAATSPTTPILARWYSLSTCDYKSTPGYRCIGCTSALHCYVNNMAIVVECNGLFHYCRDGHCSMYKGDRCLYTDTSSGASEISTNAVTTTHPANDEQSVTPDLAPTKYQNEESIPKEKQIERLALPTENNRVDENPIVKYNKNMNGRLEIYSGLARGALGDYSEISSVELKRVRRA